MLLDSSCSLIAHDNGRMQYLLSVIGTIPITYQSAPYNIPVQFWIPFAYPSMAPIVFVTPTAEMHVKAGPFVDVSGRCYHPYLAFWTSDVSTRCCPIVCVASTCRANNKAVHVIDQTVLAYSTAVQHTSPILKPSSTPCSPCFHRNHPSTQSHYHSRRPVLL